MSQPGKPLYLKRAEIQDFRSIKKAEVNFLPGLNIVIGKNGSGKTNLMHCLESYTFGLFDDEINLSKVSIELEGNKFHYIYSVPQEESPINKPNESEINLRYLSQNQALKGSIININNKHESPSISGIWDDLMNKIQEEEDCIFESILIDYGTPENLITWSSSFSASIVLNSNEINYIDSRKIFSSGTKNSKHTLHNFWNAIPFRFDTPLNPQVYISQLIERCRLLSAMLSSALKKYTSITDIRLSNQAIFNFSEAGNELNIRNMFFEFFSDGKWHYYEQLSDGTQRILFIISEVLGETIFKSINNYSYHSNEVILLEEPELGIHPHQLNQLMTFLKEESETKQIIITTHSPVVLDILNKDELDRIIISEHTPEKGSTFRHMTEEEKAEAQDYMKDLGYLSYYWRFSDFNRI